MSKEMLIVTVDVIESMDISLKTSQQQLTETNFSIGQKLLRNKRLHMFIASNNWKKIVIHVNEDIPFQYILPMLSVAENIQLVFVGNISNNIINFLCELYPDKSGAIRRYYMLGKDVKELLGA